MAAITSPGSAHPSGVLPAAAAFIALPIVVREICVGLIYCDYEQPGQSITAEHGNYLNTLRKQAALAIKQRKG